MQQTLKQARLAKGLKQSDVAETIGCAATSITHWETGRIKPPLDSLEKMCEIYGISPLDLLDHYPTINEIHEIVCKPIADRSYEETVALNFSGSISGWPDGEEATPEEIEFSTLIKDLSDRNRKFLMDLIRSMVYLWKATGVEADDSEPQHRKYAVVNNKVARVKPSVKFHLPKQQDSEMPSETEQTSEPDQSSEPISEPITEPTPEKGA